MNKDSRIYIAGHTGLFGSNTLRYLQEQGYSQFLLRTHQELDLTRQADVEKFFQQERPEYVFVMCGKVGGISANASHMAEFTMENMQMSMNLIEAAHKYGTKKLLYLGSSCMYPKASPQPVKEEYLLQGELEPTNEGYALAKLLGLKICAYYKRQYGDDFISCIPANVYGPGDNFDEAASHVIPALLKRLHYAKLEGETQVVIWGSGKPRRDFLYIDDAVRACVELMQDYTAAETINIGTGASVSIRELAETAAKVTGFQGKLVFDTTKPDGMLLRALENSKIIDRGWKPRVSLEEGLQRTYDWYLAKEAHDA